MNSPDDRGQRSIHRFRNLGGTATTSSSRAVVQSMRLIGVGALSLRPAALSQSHRFLGGRLGGSLVESVSATTPSADAPTGQVADEQTGLVTTTPVPTTTSPPPLLQWIFVALACAAAYAFYNIFIKKGSYSIQPILGGVVLQFVAALLGTLLLLSIVMADPESKSSIHYDKNGIVWSVCAGLSVGTAEMLSFVVSGMGVPATQSIPIIIGGSVMVGAILGVVILGEAMMLHGWSGVAMLVFGIGMVATDKGEKVEEGGGADEEAEAPPLIVWIGPALVCASAYAFYNIFIKLGSASINPILGGVVLQFVAAAFGTILLAILMVYLGVDDVMVYDGPGLLWAMCAGLAVGTAELLSFCVSGMGVNATQSIPIIIGGSVFFGSILGLVILGESLLLQGWLGVALLMVGIGFVATDPGEKVQGH